MDYKKIDINICNKIKDNNSIVYLIDYSEKYYNYLYEKFPWLETHIQGILTNTEDRMAGSIIKGDHDKQLKNKQVPIYSYDHITKIDEDVYFIILNDYYNEIFLKLQKIDEANNQNHFNIYFFPDYETEIQLEYRDKLKDEPLKDILVFKSGPHITQYVKGMDFDDNARAVFEYLVSEGFDSKWHIVWLVHDPDEYNRLYADHPNIEFIPERWAFSDNEEERNHYYNNLFLARYIFCTDAYGFARNCRENQIRVQLWHGCGYKTRINFVRCEHRYEYNIVIGDVYKAIHKRIYGLRDDQVLITGYPKEDWLFNPLDDWRKMFSIPEGEKYIFWMPTFRNSNSVLSELDEKGFEGDTGLPIVKSNEQVKQLNELLKELDVVLVLKLHPMQERSKIRFPKDSNICILENDRLVEKHIPINRILGNAEALISDYSSVAIDYLILDRPQAFTLEDVDEYKNSRGFVFDNIHEWLPGKEIWTFEDFTDFVREIGNGEDPDRELRAEIKEKIHDLEGGKSCERLVKMLGIEK